jgi:uncharacterized membrane protein YidH (DUF202 family)
MRTILALLIFTGAITRAVFAEIALFKNYPLTAHANSSQAIVLILIGSILLCIQENKKA